MLHAQRIEHRPAMIVELKQRPVAAIGGAIRVVTFHVALAQPGGFLDENVAASERSNRLREGRAVALVRLDVHPKSAMRRARFRAQAEGKKERGGEQRPHGGLIKGLTGFATLASLERMRLTFVCATLALLVTVADAPAQEKRGWLRRMLHPFGSSEKIPQYKNPKIRGLALTVELPSEPVKLSEVRQLPIHVILTNRADRAVEMVFPSEQRIEILLHDSNGRVVTRWSENRAFAEQVGTLLINPGEHVEYSETIATRELSSGRVFTVEVTVPAYPEIGAQRKSIAAP